MSNKHENLSSLFIDIADAIREKTGSTATIIADNFPDAIRAIDTSEELMEEITTQENVISSQDTLIASIASALEGKAAGSSAKTTKTINLDWSEDMEGTGWVEYISNGQKEKVFYNEVYFIEAEGGIFNIPDGNNYYTSNIMEFNGVLVALQDGETVYFVSTGDQ